jgi:hypothetical protein
MEGNSEGRARSSAGGGYALDSVVPPRIRLRRSPPRDSEAVRMLGQAVLRRFSSEDVVHDAAVDVGQSILAALITER